MIDAFTMFMMLIWIKNMLDGDLKAYGHSKKGITLVELIVAMTLTSIFAVLCVMLINPIERTYKGTMKLAKAQLLADTIVDSIRKECDDVRHDEAANVWITDLSGDDDEQLFDPGPANKDTSGNTLVFRRNNNYTEAIYAAVGISGDNCKAVTDNTLTPENTAHSIDTLMNAGSENLKDGYVHFGYYQAKEDKRGIFPIESYDYTNPVMAKTYGDFNVELKFYDLTLKDSKYPAYVMCKINIMEKGNVVYSRSAVLCFAANGSGKGSGSGGGHTTPTKDVAVKVRWLDANGNTMDWPSDVDGVTITLKGTNPETSYTLNGEPGFKFYNVKPSNSLYITATEFEKYTQTINGFTVTYTTKKVDKVKLITGQNFKKELTGVTSVVFRAYDESMFGGLTYAKVAVDINAKNDNNRKDDYRLYKITEGQTTTAYVTSEDGRFVANEKCNEMFSGLTGLKSVTWPSANNAFDTSRTETMQKMFQNCSSMEQFNFPDKFVRADCKDLESMLDGCTSASSVRIKNWNTIHVTTMKKMFQYFGRRSKTDFTVNIDCFKFNECKDLSKFFYNYDPQNKEDREAHITRIVFPKNIKFDNLTTLDAIFSNQTKLAEVENFKDIEAPNVTMMSSAFYRCNKLGSLTSGVVDISNFKLGNCTTFNSFFLECTSMTSLKMNECDFKKGTNFVNFCNSCKALTNVEIKNTNMTACNSFENFFSNCYALRSVKIENIVTTSLTSCKGMFQNCYSLNISKGDISGWDTSSVTNMSYMFNHACYKGGSAYESLPNNAELDISFMSFANVDNFEKMFNVDNKNNDLLFKVTLPSGDDAVTNAASVNLSGMFRRRHNLTLIDHLYDFSVTNAISNAQSMFSDNKCTTLDIRSLDITKIPKGKALYMFNECERLVTIIVMADKDYTSFSTNHSNTQMFLNDNALVGQRNTPYSTANGIYARIDDPENGKPGYFTAAPSEPPEEPEP